MAKIVLNVNALSVKIWLVVIPGSMTPAQGNLSNKQFATRLSINYNVQQSVFQSELLIH